MQKKLTPEHILSKHEKGQLAPFYLFYGQSEFQIEALVKKIREKLIPEGLRDLNHHLFYGDQIDPGDFIETARSLPFMSEERLVIIRRTERVPQSGLEAFLSYIENPVMTTTVLFLSSKANFSKKFYRRLRELNCAVDFKEPDDLHIIPWIKGEARELGLNIEGQACAYLYQIMGNRTGDLYVELEKLLLRYGKGAIGIEEVKELAIHIRIYTIFELMDEISFKRRSKAISHLDRFLEEEGKDAVLRVVGMLNRQIHLLWKTKSVVEAGGRAVDVARKIRLPVSLTRRMIKQSRAWRKADLENAVYLLYEADGLLKSGSPGRLVLENLVWSMCE